MQSCLGVDNNHQSYLCGYCGYWCEQITLLLMLLQNEQFSFPAIIQNHCTKPFLLEENVSHKTIMNIICLRVLLVLQLQTSAGRVEAVRTRVSRMVVVMVLLFLVCWGPIQILILLQAFCSEDVSHSYTLYKLKIWAHCMSYSNSSINPVIYAFMGANFRKAFRSVFPLIFKRNARTTEPLPTYNREMNFLSS